MGAFIVTSKNGLIVSYEDADELVVYDMDMKSVRAVLKKPNDSTLLEDLLEDYDVWALVTRSISEENAEIIRDAGFKIVLTKALSIDDYIKEVIV